MSRLTKLIVCCALANSSAPFWTATAAEPESNSIVHWVRDLDADTFAAREEATAALVRAGATAAPAVRTAALRGNAEVRHRAFYVLTQLADADQPHHAQAAVNALQELTSLDSYPLSNQAYCALQWHHDRQRRRERQSIDQLLRMHAVLTPNEHGLVSRCNLAMSSVPVDGLAPLAHLKQLVELDLSGTQLRDEHLQHLPALTKLQQLQLVHTHITDSGLAHLAKLTRLELLDLSATPVSDAGVKHLIGLEHLRTIRLHATGVTSAGAAQLQAVLPDCEVSY